MTVTLNWSTVEELLEANGPVVRRIGAATSQAALTSLRGALPNFCRALDPGAIAPEEFEDFGPLVLFRGNFLNGYARLVDEIADRRSVKESHTVLAGAVETSE